MKEPELFINIESLPGNGGFFVATDFADRDPSRKCTVLFSVIDKSINTVKVEAAEITNFWGSIIGQTFSVDNTWLNAREINILSKEDANEFKSRNEILIAMIEEFDRHLKISGFMKHRYNERFSLLSDTWARLKIAKFNKPIRFEFDGLSPVRATHLTNIGELVTSTHDGLKTFDLTKLSSKQISDAIETMRSTGFAASIEKKLQKETGRVLERGDNSSSLNP